MTPVRVARDLKMNELTRLLREFVKQGVNYAIQSR
jgi:hypothetical protein